MLNDIPSKLARTDEQSDAYRQIWSMHLWGMSDREIYNAVGKANDVTREEVTEVIKAMSKALQEPSYEDMSEEEVRKYLARNTLIEQELVELYFEAKQDMEMVRQGQVRYEDGRRVMPMDSKTLIAMLSAIERQSNTRASVLSKMTQDKATAGQGSGAPALQKPSINSLSRTPEEEVVDVQVIEK